jgi:Fe-S-cluster containining protein
VVELRISDGSVPDELVVERDGIQFMDQRMNGACVALDPLTQLCSIYDERPQVCREFERGGSLCLRTLRRSFPASRGEPRR